MQVYNIEIRATDATRYVWAAGNSDPPSFVGALPEANLGATILQSI
jgi:hypothetical protein